MRPAAKRMPYRRPEPTLFRMKPIVDALAAAGVVRLYLPFGALTFRDTLGRLCIVVA